MRCLDCGAELGEDPFDIAEHRCGEEESRSRSGQWLRAIQREKQEKRATRKEKREMSRPSKTWTYKQRTEQAERMRRWWAAQRGVRRIVSRRRVEQVAEVVEAVRLRVGSTNLLINPRLAETIHIG